jgi:Fic family protein
VFKDGPIGTFVQRRWEPGPSSFPGMRPGEISCFVPPLIAGLDEPIDFILANRLVSCEGELRALSVRADALLVDAAMRALLRAEAVSSSRIEGLQLGHRRLAKASLTTSYNDTARAVLANLEAVSQAIVAIDRGETITPELLTSLHARLLEGASTGYEPGSFRTIQNWIGRHATPLRAEFVPPPPELVPGLMEDLCAFAARDDLPPVLQAALVHAQFETIHPFAGGNGRIGRIVILLVLRRRGVTPRLVPPVSLVLLAHQQAYVDALQDYRRASRTPWLSLFIDACSIAASGAMDLSERIGVLQEVWRDAANRPRRDSAAERLIAVLPATPIMNLEVARTLTGRSDQATLAALGALQAAGVLRETTAGRRNRVWESTGLFALLEQFERDYGDPQRTPASTRPS